MSSQPEIYFHVGLGKIASTYLQHRFFPKMKGIKYIPTVHYKRRSKQIIEKGGHDKFLVSREFDRQFEREVKWFTESYPDSKIIIFFRRHDSWIASQYRRYVKNGNSYEFEEFIDVDNDEGFWKKKYLTFYPLLKIIEECSSQKPLIIFHDEVKKDIWSVFDKICQYTGASYNREDISTKPFHTSYNEKQLKVIKAFTSRFVKKAPKSYENRIIRWILYKPWWVFFHLILYVALIIPESWVTKKPLINPESLKKVRDTFQDDWEKIQAYAAENNGSIGIK